MLSPTPPPHQLATMVSELRRLDEESILQEASELDKEAAAHNGLLYWLPGASRKQLDGKSYGGPPSSTSYITRLPLEVSSSAAGC